jgi:hypothetical protein
MAKQVTPPPPALADLFVRAYRAGLRWSAILEDAGVARSTWLRMTAGEPYKPETLEKVTSALEARLPPKD